MHAPYNKLHLRKATMHFVNCNTYYVAISKITTHVAISMCRDYIQLLVVAIETAFLKSSHPTTKVNLTRHEKTVLMYTKYSYSFTLFHLFQLL